MLYVVNWELFLDQFSLVIVKIEFELGLCNCWFCMFDGIFFIFFFVLLFLFWRVVISNYWYWCDNTEKWKMVTFFEADFSDLEFLMFLFIFCNRWRTSALKVQGGHSHAAVNITERERARAWVDEFQNKNIKENFVILSRFLHRNLSNLWHLQVNYLVKVTTKFHSTSSFIQEACNIITLGKLK